ERVRVGSGCAHLRGPRDRVRPQHPVGRVLVRSAVAVVGGVIVSAVIVIGTINAYDRLVAACPGFCYFSQQLMYGHPVGEGRGAIPFIEIAVPAAAVALFVARALSPAGRQFAPALTAAWLAPLLLVGGYWAYLFLDFLAHPRLT